jgi:hypothetical protein
VSMLPSHRPIAGRPAPVAVMSTAGLGRDRSAAATFYVSCLPVDRPTQACEQPLTTIRISRRRRVFRPRKPSMGIPTGQIHPPRQQYYAGLSNTR